VSRGPRPFGVDPAAASFNGLADAYERARPGYPAAAVDWLTEELALGPGRVVVDLGAGTGKLTRLLVERGSAVTAIEPLPAMRAELARRVPAAVVRRGTAEATKLADASADVVVAAQAAHWFERPAFLHEVARVLRPGGGLALLWNERAETLPWWVDLFAMIQAGVDRGWDTDIDWVGAIAESGRFGPVAVRGFPYEQVLDLDGLLELVASRSYVASRPSAERSEVLDAVRRHVAGIAEPFVVPYVTTVYLCRSSTNLRS
jgi:SAM-dependent methyltransferase